MANLPKYDRTRYRYMSNIIGHTPYYESLTSVLGNFPAPTMTMTPKAVLVTGQPGCGKTYLVQALYERLRRRLPPATYRISGFYTDEVAHPSKASRCGFDIVTVPEGKRGVFARKGLSSQHKTGAIVALERAMCAIVLLRFYSGTCAIGTVSPQALHLPCTPNQESMVSTWPRSKSWRCPSCRSTAAAACT